MADENPSCLFQNSPPRCRDPNKFSPRSHESSHITDQYVSSIQTLLQNKGTSLPASFIQNILNNSNACPSSSINSPIRSYSGSLKPTNGSISPVQPVSPTQQPKTLNLNRNSNSPAFPNLPNNKSPSQANSIPVVPSLNPMGHPYLEETQISRLAQVACELVNAMPMMEPKKEPTSFKRKNSSEFEVRADLN